MITVVKFVILLLLTWLLFMGCNSNVNFVAALGTTATEQQQQQQSPEQQKPIYGAAAVPAVPLTAPTAIGATNVANDDFATPALPNGVDYSNATEYSSDNNDAETDDERSPSEVQKAVCTVTAGEVRASAEAVTTKTLKGVCGSAELKLAFSNLEAKLYRELQEIKILLQYIAQHYGINVPSMESIQTPTTTTPAPVQVAPAPSGTRPPTIHFPGASTTADIPKFQPVVMPRQGEQTIQASAQSESTMPHEPHQQLPQLKSLSRQVKHNALQQEVSRFNNSMLGDRDLKVFTYYWKLDNFTARIQTAKTHTVESPTFSIKGKPLHLKAYFQHLHRDFLYLQLELANFKSDNSNHKNIILDMGGLFKQIVDDQVIFKHKISILNQHNQRSKDLVSPEFHNLETGFLIPNSALLGSPYIKNNSLLIQIFLYL